MSTVMTTITTLDKIKALQKVVLFAQCKTDQLLEIATIAREVTFQKDDLIFREHDRGDSLYCIVSGRVRMKKAGTSYETIVGEGEAFDTLAILDRKPRAVSATAETDIVALCINSDDFYDLLADNIEIVQGIFTHLAHELRTCLDMHSAFDLGVQKKRVA